MLILHQLGNNDRSITDNESQDLRGLHGSGALLCVFALVLAKSLSPALGSPVKDVLAVLVHLELDNDDLAGVDTDIDGGAIGLLPLDPLNVDSELLPVALDDLAHLLTLVVAPDDLKLFELFEIGGNNERADEQSDQRVH